MTAARRLLVVSSPCRGEQRSLGCVPGAAKELYDVMVDPERGQCTPVTLGDQLLTGPLDDPDLSQARDALANAVKQCAKRDELLVLAWLGHGFADRARNFYLMPRGADNRHPKTTGLDLIAWLSAVIGDHGATLPGLLVLLDACYAGSAITAAAQRLVSELDQQHIALEILAATSARRQAYNASFTLELVNILRTGVAEHGGEHLASADLKPLLLARLEGTQQHPQHFVFDVRLAGRALWIGRNIGCQRMARAARLAALSHEAADRGEQARAVRLAVLACRETGDSVTHPEAAAALYRAADGNRLLVQLPSATPVLFSPDGQSVLAFDGNRATLVDAVSGAIRGPEMLHRQCVRLASFSTDGTKLVTATSVELYTWDAATGAAMGEPVTVEGQLTCMIASLTVMEDETIRCVFCNYDCKVPVVVDLGVGQTRRTLEADDGSVFFVSEGIGAAAATRDGRYVAVATLDGEIIVWRGTMAVASDAALASDNLALAPRQDERLEICRRFKHGGWINSLQFTADGRRLLVASDNGTAAIWQADEERPQVAQIIAWQPSLTEHKPLEHPRPLRVMAHVEAISESSNARAGVSQATFSADESLVATASKDRTARLWQADAFSTASSTNMLQHDDSVRTVCLSPDGHRVATGTADGVGRFWGRRSYRCRWPVASSRYMSGRIVWYTRFSPDGQLVVMPLTDCAVQLRAVAAAARVGAELEHPDTVLRLSFSVDGSMVVLAGGSCAQMWDVARGARLGAPLSHEDVLSEGRSYSGHEVVVFDAGFSPDGRVVATVDTGGQAFLWDVQTGVRLAGIKVPPKTMRVEFSSCGSRLLTFGSNGCILWDVASAAAPRSLASLEHQPLDGQPRNRFLSYCATFDRKSQHVVTGASDGSLRLWDAQKGECIGRPMRQGSAGFNSLEFHPDCSTFVAGSVDGTARLWHVASCKPIGAEMRHDHSIVRAGFSRDGRRIVTASTDQTARVWDGRTGTCLGAPIEHDAVVGAACFSPVDDTLLTASAAAVTLWDLPFSIITKTPELIAAACASLPEPARRIGALDLKYVAEFIGEEALGSDVAHWVPTEI